MIFNEKWDLVLKDELEKDYFKKLGIFVKNEYKNKTIYPAYNNIFKALRLTDYDKVKVVIFFIRRYTITYRKKVTHIYESTKVLL